MRCVLGEGVGELCNNPIYENMATNLDISIHFLSRPIIKHMANIHHESTQRKLNFQSNKVHASLFFSAKEKS